MTTEMDDLLELLVLVYQDSEAAWLDDIDETTADLQALWRVRGMLVGIMHAAKAMHQAIDADIAQHIQGAQVQLGGHSVKRIQGRRLRCHDPVGLKAFLHDALEEGVDGFEAFNVNSVRVTALREIAARLELDPDYALDTFYIEELYESKQQLSIMPMDMVEARRDLRDAEKAQSKALERRLN